MNGAKKWHKSTGPAFLAGEKWYAHAGKFSVTIVSVRRYPGATTDHTSDYGVTYEWMQNGAMVQHEKDAWNFQVRYQHAADINL